MYLNLDNNTTPIADSPNFIGYHNIAVTCGSDTEQKPEIDCFDITDQLKIILRNHLNNNGDLPNSLNLTIVPKYCDKTWYATETNTISFNELYIVLMRVEDTLQKESHTRSESSVLLDQLLSDIPEDNKLEYEPKIHKVWK